MSLLSAAGCRGCDVCSLRNEWGQLKHPRMLPSGVDSPDLYIVGEAPGAEEDAQGTQFIGSSGRLLRELLPPSIKIRWSNTVRCRPPSNRKPTQDEIFACAMYNEEDIARTKPKVVLVLGAAALKWASGADKITSWRGLSFPLTIAGHKCWGTTALHPAFVLRQGGAEWNNPSYTLLQKDIKLALELLQRPLTLKPPPPFQIKTPGLASQDDLAALLEEDALGFDIETDGLSPWKSTHGLLSFAFGTHTGYGLALPIALHSSASVQEANRDFLKKFFTSYEGAIVCHALSFELSWLLHEFDADTLFRRIQWHDSLSGVRNVLNREHPLGLDDNAFLLTGVRVKALTHVNPTQWRQTSPDVFLKYNGIDAVSTLVLADRLQLFNSLSLEYKRLVDASIATTLMSHTGLEVDIQKCKEAEVQGYLKVREETQSLRERVDIHEWEAQNNTVFDPLSPKKVAEFLEDQKLLSPGQGTGEEILRNIDHPVAHAVLTVRRLEKSTSYLTNWQKEATDSVLHPRYTVCLVATGRLSSESPNIQNVPKRKDKWIRECIVARPGHEFLALDYSQIELRVLAMLSKDAVLVQELWAKEDLHAHWATRTTELYPEILNRIAQEYDTDDTNKIFKTLRDEIKRGITFALPYGASDKTPGRILQLPEDISLQLASEYWQHYPGIRAWQKQCRQSYLKTGDVDLAFTPAIRTGLLEGNEPINTRVQGTAARLVICAMVRLTKKAQTTGDSTYLPRINIHDDLTFELPLASSSDYARGIGEEMVRVVHPIINVPLVVEVTHGPDWYNQTPLPGYSSTDFGHRRRQLAVASEVSAENLLGGTWARRYRTRTRDTTTIS